MPNNAFPYVPLETQRQLLKARPNQIKILVTDAENELLEQAAINMCLGTRQDVIRHALAYYFANTDEAGV